ncbi:MAG: hypothetical protein ACLPVY_22580 [Acidimicrobiia bacterium]
MPTSTPAHGWVPDVVVDVVVDDVVDDGGGFVVDVVVDDGGAIVVVVVVLVDDVVVVVDDVGAGVVDVIVVDVVLDEGGGSVPWLEGTQSSSSGAKKRRCEFVTRTGKHTRSIAVVAVDEPVGTHNTSGSRTRTENWPTVTGNGGANRPEVEDGEWTDEQVNVTNGTGTTFALAAPNWTAGSSEHVHSSRPDVSVTAVALNSFVTATVVGGWCRRQSQSPSQARRSPGLLIPKVVPFGSDTATGSHPPWRTSLVQR